MDRTYDSTCIFISLFDWLIDMMTLPSQTPQAPPQAVQQTRLTREVAIFAVVVVALLGLGMFAFSGMLMLGFLGLITLGTWRLFKLPGT